MDSNVRILKYVFKSETEEFDAESLKENIKLMLDSHNIKEEDVNKVMKDIDNIIKKDKSTATEPWYMELDVNDNEIESIILQIYPTYSSWQRLRDEKNRDVA